MSLIVYSSYKPSGVAWLGNVPAHWPVSKLKFISRFVNGGAFSTDDWSNEGVPIIRIQNLNGSEDYNYIPKDQEVNSKYHVHPNELLFSWSGNKGTSFGPHYYKGTSLGYLNQHIFRVVDVKAEVAYFYWALKAVTFEVEKNTSGIIGLVHVTKEELDNIFVPLPPPDEQRAIAAFLNRKTAEIDEAIANLELLIERLHEYRSAVITQAVTRGLDPSVPLKESGILWLGQVPQHWEVRRLKYVIKALESGVSVNSRDFPSDGEMPAIMKTSCALHGKFKPQENKEVYEEEEVHRLACKLRKGEIVISRMNTPDLVGENGYVEDDYDHLFLPDRMWQTIQWPSSYYLINMQFLNLVLQSKPFRSRVSELATGSSPSMKNLAQEDLMNIALAIPPLDEQEEIRQSITAQYQEIDSSIESISSQTQQLYEYRIALITAAVTGQIDVRHLA